MTSGPFGEPGHDFTVEMTRPVLERACRTAGLGTGEVRVLRHHSNAVYLVGHAPEQVVVKIGRPGPDRDQDLRDAQGGVELTRWLGRCGVPVTTLVDTVPQPLSVDGHVVTLWHYLPQHRSMTTTAIAGPLFALHHAPLPPIRRPPLDPYAAVTRSISASRILAPEQRALLLDRLDRLAPAWAALCAGEPDRLIHTDPQHRNTLWRTQADPTGTAGGAVLCDLDDVTRGPVDWDLATIEIHSRRFGHGDYDAFCRAYGRDVRDRPDYTDLRDLRELRMISTNARKSTPGSAQAAEVLRRIDGVGRTPDQLWRIL